MEDDVKKEMEMIKKNAEPSRPEALKYIRYLINVQKYGKADVLEEVAHWDKEIVEASIKEVDRENSKPKPKRYYVSLKEPLEDSSLR